MEVVLLVERPLGIIILERVFCETHRNGTMVLGEPEALGKRGVGYVLDVVCELRVVAP